MADNMRVNIKGLAQLGTALNQLPDRVARRALMRGTRAGARIIGMAAREIAPKRTGRLRRNIVWRINRKYTRRGRVAFDIGVREEGSKDNPNNAYYWYFLEFGTSKMKAEPTLRPATDEKQSAAIEAIALRLKQAIDAIAESYAGAIR